MTIRELCEQAFKTAAEKGWHLKERTPLEFHALIASEIGEATDAARLDRPEIYFDVPAPGCGEFSGVVRRRPGPELMGQKPLGELTELADAVIRIADYCESRGWDLEQAIKFKMEFNKSRPQRHGGKLY